MGIMGDISDGGGSFELEQVIVATLPAIITYHFLASK